MFDVAVISHTVILGKAAGILAEVEGSLPPYQKLSNSKHKLYRELLQIGGRCFFIFSCFLYTCKELTYEVFFFLLSFSCSPENEFMSFLESFTNLPLAILVALHKTTVQTREMTSSVSLVKIWKIRHSGPRRSFV